MSVPDNAFIRIDLDDDCCAVAYGDIGFGSRTTGFRITAAAVRVGWVPPPRAGTPGVTFASQCTYHLVGDLPIADAIRDASRFYVSTSASSPFGNIFVYFFFF